MKHFSKITIALFCVSVLLLQSCKKETNGLFRLSATIEKYNHDNKVHIETDNVGSYACWDDGDQVTINGIAGVVGHDANGYYIQSQSGSSFSDEGGHQEFAALYPTNLFLAGGGDYHGTTVVNLPQTQTYIGGSNGTQKIEAPMIAYMAAGSTPPDNNHTMQFKNVCALIKVNITNTSSSQVGIKRIEIVNGDGHTFWGDYSANVSANDQSLVEPSDYADIASKIITRKATLNVNGQTIGAGANKSFYIYVPAVAYSNLVLTVFTTDNKYRTYTGSVTGTSFLANTIYSKSITYDGGADWKTISSLSGDVDGVFTVSATTIDGVTTYKKVKFAHGNLLSDGSFATNQYDYKGYFGNQESVKDMFSLSNIPSNLPTGYSLLTSAEWDYLLTTASRGNIRWVPAMVNYIPGIILFPDGFSTPSGITIIGSNSLYTETTSNSFSIDQWNTLETAGCVFLPRINWTSRASWSLSVQCYYWNKEVNNTRNAMSFGWAVNSQANPTYGAYIRLVKEQPSNTK